MKAIRKSGDELIERIQLVHGPYWDSRLDLVKTVLGITSAILVGTIAFSGSLIGPGKTGLSCAWTLYLSWVLFFVSIISASFSLWHLYKIKSIHVTFFNKSDEITNKLENVGARDDELELEKEIMNIVGSAVKESVVTARPSDEASHNTLFIQLLTFVAGLLMFLIFGVLQNV